MNFKLRLSIHSDLDLIALAQDKSFNMGKKVVQALKAYVEEGALAHFPTPDIKPPVSAYKREVNFTLNDMSDIAVIEWINSIKQGQRSSAIKRVFLYSIEGPVLTAHSAAFPLDDLSAAVGRPIPDRPVKATAPAPTQPKAAPAKHVKPPHEAPVEPDARAIFSPGFFEFED